jgi:hypothetical protein
LSEGSKKALSSLLYNLGGDVGKLHQHGMYEAILRNDVAAMKQAHVQFSHVHGPTGPMVQGLLSRRRDELQYYDQPARLPSGLLTSQLTQVQQRLQATGSAAIKPVQSTCGRAR